MKHQGPWEVAQGLVGLLLEQAFMRARSSGYVLNVTKIDGVPHEASTQDGGASVIDVVIEGGMVRRCFVPFRHA